MQVKDATEAVIDYMNKTGIMGLKNGDQLVVLSRRTLETGITLDDHRLAARAFIVGDEEAVVVPYKVDLFAPP
jgi:hypothetical protein